MKQAVAKSVRLSVPGDVLPINAEYVNVAVSW
jgi:hypothetical protein